MPEHQGNGRCRINEGVRPVAPILRNSNAGITLSDAGISPGNVELYGGNRSLGIPGGTGETSPPRVMIYAVVSVL